MNRTQLDYADIVPGDVHIYLHRGVVTVVHKGFKFNTQISERAQNVMAMTWARDVLQATLDSDRVAPGLRINSGRIKP